MKGAVANIAATMRGSAPMRSIQAARLKNSHQRSTARAPPNIPPTIPYILASGTKWGSRIQADHCSATAKTPGQTRNGFFAIA